MSPASLYYLKWNSGQNENDNYVVDTLLSLMFVVCLSVHFSHQYSFKQLFHIVKPGELSQSTVGSCMNPDVDTIVTLSGCCCAESGCNLQPS